MHLPKNSDEETFFLMADGEVMYRTEDRKTYIHWPVTRRRENWVLMQYTGLKDKNGKEIFEGDILQANHFPRQLIVGFCKESAAFGACTDESMEINKMYWFANDIVLDQDDWCVIGNIHEHPDLITVPPTQGNG